MMPELSPEQVDAVGRMSKEVHDSYRNFGYAGVFVDPVRYLALWTQTHNHKHLAQVVNDQGVFFMDGERKIKYRLNPAPMVLVYNDGFTREEEKKLLDPEAALITMDRGLKFWNWPRAGVCLVADGTHDCDFILPEYKKELERAETLQGNGTLTIKPMLFDKKKP